MDTKTPLRRVRSNLAARHHQEALEGRFVVERVLQKAIFGEILLARSVENRGRRVVLKAVNKKLAKERVCRRGTHVFESHDIELEILRRVRERPHDHLIGLCPEEDQVNSGSFKYTAIPFMEGGELFSRVDEEGALPEDEARELVRGIARGLSYLHSEVGFSHNDVSLENVLLDRDGSPVLCDYGLAKKIGAKWDAKRSISGKLPYQPPEIYFGTAAESSGQSDVFSLGVTAFVLLCGIPPFDLPDPNVDQRYNYIQMGKMSDLLHLWGKSVGPDAVDLMSKMLVHDPHERISIEDVLSHPWLAEEDEMDLSEEEEMETIDLSRGRSIPISRASPVSSSTIEGMKSSPDSVFSFERAYRNHVDS